MHSIRVRLSVWYKLRDKHVLGKIFAIALLFNSWYYAAMDEIISLRKPNYCFHPPEISADRWCDFRVDLEAGMTLKDIGLKYMCDQRTVRQCIILNKSSQDLGRQFAPTKLSPFIDQINQIYEELSGGCPAAITHISRQITEIISKSGYQGSERTVRNYLRKEYQHDHHQDNT